MTIEAPFGREADTRVIVDAAASRERVLLVVGDSGIGKSFFLQSLTSGWEPGDLVAAPVLLGELRGSLQNSLAIGIGDCLRQFMTENPASAVAFWKELRGAVERTASVTGRQVIGLFVTRAFEFMESKLGAEATKAIRNVLGEVLAPSGQSYEDRLEMLVLPDVAEHLSGLAREIAKHTKRRLIILLDGGERLGQDDRGLLVELATSLGEAVRLVVCVNSAVPGGVALVEAIESRGSKIHELLALESSAINDWLAAARIAEPDWRHIQQVSSGYPLFIAEAIQLINDGVALTGIRSLQSFQALFRQAWRALDGDVQVMVSKLASFVDPPSDDFLSGFLALDLLELSLLRKRLRDRNVFILRADGTEWFHERRRLHIWSEELTAVDRAFASRAVLISLHSWLAGPSVVGGWVPRAMPELIRGLDTGDREEYFTKLLELQASELAILWALIEVVEPGGNRGLFADVGQITSYASIRAGLEFDPINSIELLVSLGLIVLVADEHSSLIALVKSDAVSYLALTGEIEREFLVRPIPRLASTAFATFVRPRIGPFKSAVVSLGGPSTAEYRRAWSALQEKHGVNYSHPLTQPPGLGFVFVIDEHSVTVTATFESLEDRDSASKRIVAGQEHFNEGRVTFEQVISLPPERVRHERYALLLEHLVRNKSSQPATGGEQIAALLDSRLRVLEVLRSRMTDYEASALDVEDHQRYLIEVVDALGHWIEYSVVGGISAATIVIQGGDTIPLSQDPLCELRLRARGLLSEGEQINLRTEHFSTSGEVPHPMRWILEEMANRGKSFNKGLPLVHIPFESEALAEAIQLEREITEGLRRELTVDSIVDEDVIRDCASSLYVYLQVSNKSEFSGNLSWVSYFDVADGKGAVVVRTIPEDWSTSLLDSTTDAIDLLGLSTPDLIRGRGHGESSFVLARLLGYNQEDVIIDFPESIP